MYVYHLVLVFKFLTRLSFCKYFGAIVFSRNNTEKMIFLFFTFLKRGSLLLHSHAYQHTPMHIPYIHACDTQFFGLQGFFGFFCVT